MDRGRKIWSLIAASLLASVVVAVPASPAGAQDDPWIDTWDRDAVLAAWETEFGRTEPAMGFTGDVGSCVAGTTSQAFRDSVLQRVNWYRRMAGLDTVVENAEFSSANQQAATMMAAAGELSHAPGGGWACHTSAGATAAGKSNLALGLAGVDAIDAYMQDFGASNTKVGHRRTILYPQVQEMGTGDVPFGPGNWSSNTLHVFDANLWNQRPDVREDRDFVAWPPSGYVPAETVWGRWSFSLARADFSTATVTVSNNAGPVQVEILERIQSGGLIAPEASIVWAVGGDTDSGPMPTPTTGDDCYNVTISGVTMSGAPMDPFVYSSCILDPLAGSSGSPASGITGPICPELEFSAWTTPCWNGATLQALPFVDVNAGWQQLPVSWLVANEITTGTTPSTFSPNGYVTRAQAATFVWRMAGAPAPSPNAPTFADVRDDAYYRDAVRWMAENGITTGTSDSTFSPGGVATRAELVTFLWRLVDRPDVGDAARFQDLTASWQAGPVGWAAEVGVTTGTSSTTFDPNSPVTRGQTAAMLKRLADALAEPG
ncbi:MAG: S-layer homology domain-containing protein [Actinomycetota bacterium]